ncbi:hypothetical protein AOQ84DRAFT_283122 [Glonium stellatum]|uniref:Fatty acid hydroxylase domain-containing protein n=1 Tax=Glonium stellatum TaxID=574774 RepID=A0A8E2FAK2_9PEZI|nr:hypothetical protein AOQ84DRAFT_283122 [Glonium stellatum]
MTQLASFCHDITSSSPTILFISFLWLWLTGSFFFDIVHYLLHQCSKSQHRSLRLVGQLHMVHHLYFNRRLQFNNRYRWHNICVELPLELGCQLFGTWLGWLVAKNFGLTGPGYLSKQFFSLVLIVEIARELIVAILDGRDSNHKTYSTVPKDPNWFMVGPEYHALHHVNPKAYISSAFYLFDWLFGTGYTLQSRRITLTGASGAFGEAIKKELQHESVKCIQELEFGADWTYDSYDATIPTLANTDVLILAHSSEWDDTTKTNSGSTAKLIELFRQHRQAGPGHKMLLPEVWYVGNDAELHPSWGIPSLQLFSHSKHVFPLSARALYNDSSILYRHIVVSAFSSSTGPAVASAKWTARAAMWWIRRGAQYVPVTYTGLAYLYYLKLLSWLKKI